MKGILALCAVMMLSGCFGLLSSDLDPRSPEDHGDEFIEAQGIDLDAVEARKVDAFGQVIADENDVSQQEESVRTVRMDPDEQKAAIYYADLMCAAADPEFWSDLFDDETDTMNEDAAFYTQHGYAGEDAANDAVALHWGKKDFKTEAKKIAAARCAPALEKAGVNFSDLVERETP